ncbi:MAG: site-specific DNA-methyltransferase [Anaerolineae bacterium]|nr:site-specific DNA-methyltransferase [Anaerolineae bacterium]
MTDKTPMLASIRAAEQTLAGEYADVLVVNPDLDRKLVSFQANKTETAHRWFKYKEGFSAALMRYVFERTGIEAGHILDPFAGAGTALFAASDLGMDATGVELLPSSAEAIEVKRLLLQLDRVSVADSIAAFAAERSWEQSGPTESFGHITITAGAFPPATEYQLGRYLFETTALPDTRMGRILRFAALSVLEAISYTRKDGQYLRWDYRSGRRAGSKPFDKGRILDFTEAITAKLAEMEADLGALDSGYYIPRTLFDVTRSAQRLGEIELLVGSCLDIMPQLPAEKYDGLVTSPPYCNRYDYTRTYALELAMMGIGEAGIRDLRQAMLSCTVENREKADLADKFGPTLYEEAQNAFASQELLANILGYLEACRQDGSINNPGIPRMVRNYFREMSLVIFEGARLLKPGAPLVMVNDNVRYQGAHVPVDLILSDMAKRAGFSVETIWVLPRGKGNSSQQMSEHGREEVRKCVYIWRRAREPRATTRDPQVALAS